MSHRPSVRRRGGQPGNSNRLRHGLYSRRLAPVGGSLDADFQIALARRRLAQLLDRQEASSSPRDFLSYERGILHYLSLIICLQESRSVPGRLTDLYPTERDGHPFVGVLDSLHLLDEDADATSEPAEKPIRTSEQSVQNPRYLPEESPLRSAHLFPRTRLSEPADQERS